MGPLTNKVAIVTGAASGFGAEIARQYVAEGAKVAVADINEDGARTVADSLGENAIAVRSDVTRQADIQLLVTTTTQRVGTPDIVVNNAGTTHKNQPLLETDEQTFDREFAVNVKSIYYMTLAIVPWLRQQLNGVILNIGSVAGIRRRPGLTWYNSSKGAVNLLSKSLAVELGPDGIRVNAICPVMGESALLEAFMGCRIRRRTGRSSSRRYRSGGLRGRATSRQPRCSSQAMRPSSSAVSSAVSTVRGRSDAAAAATLGGPGANSCGTFAARRHRAGDDAS